MKKQLLAQAVVTAMLTMSASALAADAAPKPAMEKCYGISKAGKNDCAVKGGHSCAGLSKTNDDPKEWIYTPKGTCKEKGGSMESK